MNWFVLSVRPKHETAVAERLAAKSLEPYVPLYKVRRRWSDRIQTLELPLFPRYVFCQFSSSDRAKILSTPSVISIVAFGGEPAPISIEEINFVKKMVTSGARVSPWAYLGVGQRVRICRGPLCGVEGIVQRLKSRCRVVVNIDLLQCAAAVEVDEASLISIRRA